MTEAQANSPLAALNPIGPTSTTPLKAEQGFTDARLTSFRLCSALVLAAKRLSSFKGLSEGMSVKVGRHRALGN